MPSGFRMDTDSWLKEYEEAKRLAQEVLQLTQERNMNNAGGGPEASRKSATARRKLGTLGTLIEKLLKALDAPDETLSEAERNRRRDLLYDLRNRREQMQAAIKRTPAQSDREMLLGNGQQGQGSAGPRETEATAALGTDGLLSLQKQMMRDQDDVLEKMEKSVRSTKHIALAIGEEADLQTRLLEDVDDQVDVTHSRLKAATLRVKQVMRDKSHWKGGLCIFLLIVTLVILVILTSKLARIFGF